MKKYTIGDKVYRLAQDGRVIRETIFSVFETASSVHYNASMPAHSSGFTEAFDSNVEALEHEINALKEKLSKKRAEKFVKEGYRMDFPNPDTCSHDWEFTGTVLLSHPHKREYQCTVCGQRCAK